MTGTSWTIVPASPLLPADQIANQEWILTLSGVHELTLLGNDGHPRPGSSYPIVGYQDLQSPLTYALDLYGIAYPPPEVAFPFFQVHSGPATFVVVNGMETTGTYNGGLAWDTSLSSAPDRDGNLVSNLFDSISAYVNVDGLGMISRLVYNTTLRGRIVFI
ncbi:hypothetical protein [Mycobacterium kiyosense]|uniref:Uncharacterized protein n=1 Tax=Mycobacterium kiyosense TaxID=2871094 RepID=A0A9P3QCJ8_9MYCO|nr:hypothetical protein [Mycobacterium kiyosense]BDB40156.1 hypothetical protein IWGMT90018_06020 [Mycobacterium kiyosense]GLB85181.1 hypothetical protein SRL2020028_44370 [Mycobacterium kiyosense]GLB92524.1 hypothetical protein SRL2020130_53410 [Mycobacterium kiyosense]GLB99113.1 hypothetical protein SRL2020226_58890 [Mycobacterium kiyosense]GLC04749.1 hypothetical protein SRL2020400_53400 [Mycobacterium kiyosense]